MRKKTLLLLILAVVILCVVLASCSPEAPADDLQDSNVSQTEVPADDGADNTPAQPGEGPSGLPTPAL